MMLGNHLKISLPTRQNGVENRPSSSFLVLLTTGIFRGALRKPQYLGTYGIKKRTLLTLKCLLQTTDTLQTSCKVQNPHRIDVKNSVSH